MLRVSAEKGSQSTDSVGVRQIDGSGGRLMTTALSLAVESKSSSLPIGIKQPLGITNLPDQLSRADSLKKPTAMIPSVVIQSLAAQHMEHIDPQATYQKLGKIGSPQKRGQKSRNVIIWYILSFNFID